MLFFVLFLVMTSQNLSICVPYSPLLLLKWPVMFLTPALPVLTLTSPVLTEAILCGIRNTYSTQLVCALSHSSSSHARFWVTHKGKNTITMQPFFPDPLLSLNATGAYFSYSREKYIYFDLCFPICSSLTTRSWSPSKHIISAYLCFPTKKATYFRSQTEIKCYSLVHG